MKYENLAGVILIIMFVLVFGMIIGFSYVNYNKCKNSGEKICNQYNLSYKKFLDDKVVCTNNDREFKELYFREGEC